MSHHLPGPVRPVLRRRRDERNNPLGPFGVLFAWILAPIAAVLIQMAVSRSREYQADASGAELSHDPLALASALQKLESASRRCPRRPRCRRPRRTCSSSTRSAGRKVQFASLFSTHPPTQARIERLEEMAGGRIARPA